jgi:hypothetical protein
MREREERNGYGSICTHAKDFIVVTNEKPSRASEITHLFSALFQVNRIPVLLFVGMYLKILERGKGLGRTFPILLESAFIMWKQKSSCASTIDACFDPASLPYQKVGTLSLLITALFFLDAGVRKYQDLI